MPREQKDFRDDFKLRVTFLQENPDYDPETEGSTEYIVVDPRETPFIINLFSVENDKKIKSTNFQATWDLTTATNFEFDDENTAVLVIFNNDPELRKQDKGLFKIGMLHGTIWFAYEDSQMPDDAFNCGKEFNTNIDIINIDLIENYE